MSRAYRGRVGGPALPVAVAGALLLSACVGGETPEATPTTPARSTQMTPAEAEPRTVTIAAAGDILPHRPVVTSARRYAQGTSAEFDFRPMFAEVRSPVSAADVALCHLETPLSANDRDLAEPNTLVFNSPREVATALAWAGFDGCEFASNHTWDHGLDGLRQTIQVVTEEGMAYAGPRAQQGEAGSAAFFEAQGVRVAHLAYTYTLLNAGHPNTDVPPEAPWTGRALWPMARASGILADVRAARADGAEVVVVSLHWGAEYVTEPTQDQRELAEALLTSGEVDAILGSHVHVVQPCETIDGRPAVYGMGNFLSNQSSRGGTLPAATQDGVIIELTFTVEPDDTVTSELAYQPTTVDLDGHVIEIATEDTHPSSYARTVTAIESLGPGVCDATVMASAADG